MNLAETLRGVTLARQLENERLASEKALAEKRRLSVAAEDYLISQTTPEALRSAVLEDKKSVRVNSYGPDYSGEEYNRYYPEYATGRLAAHIEMLKGEGFQVELKNNDGWANLTIEWMVANREEVAGEEEDKNV